MPSKKQIGIKEANKTKKTRYILSVNPVNNGEEYIISKYKDSSCSKQVYLTDVFDFTPPGFLYKDETGMGATTLELKAKRHSIIVEPIKITASSKAAAVNALYVGSQTKYHPDKTVPVNKIKAYANNSSIDYKKIIVVADSLSKVIKAIGPAVFNDYFILIDEIDSFQMDSVFRRSMEEVLDIYKKFDKDKRALLSATRIAFSDPILKKEPLTLIKYNQPHQRTINILTTVPSNLAGLAADYLTELSQNFPEDKVFVAYNSVSGVLDLADHLVKTGVYKIDEVKILCSSASEGRVPKYYHELDSDILPGKINFFTSAYFTGYDLKEKYHLVSISSSRRPMNSLSDKKLKQIAGRCRYSLYSETIIHDFSKSNDDLKLQTEDILIEAAQHQVDAMSCTRRHYRQSPVLSMLLGDFSTKMMSYLEEKTFMYIREDSSKNYVISYLNIDASLESKRVRTELYTTEDDLYKKLQSDGNIVTQVKQFTDTQVDESSTYQDQRNQEVEYIIKRLERVGDYNELHVILEHEPLTSLQKLVVTDYHKLYKYVDKQKMLAMIEKSLKSKDSRSYKNLMRSAHVQILHESCLLVQRLDHHFPIQAKKGKILKEEKLTADVIKLRMDMFFSELGYSTPPRDTDGAIKALNLYRETSKRYDSKGKKSYFVITGKNPHGVPVLQTMPKLHAEDIYKAIFL
ncbi:MAG: hypothetical protein RLZZ172_484 [Bacteroidota bacterium]|jgi:hypothetical protein